MNKKKKLMFLFLLAGMAVAAQDTLPKFKVVTIKKNGTQRTILSWKNNFDMVQQISIQRSPDSLNNFKTIMTIANPMAKINGFADTKPPTDKQFYRLFILLDKGDYLFSPVKKPMIIIDSAVLPEIPRRIAPSPSNTAMPTLPEEPLFPTIKPDYSKTDKLNLGEQNSGVSNRNINSSQPRPNVFVPSLHVYTYKDGNVRITLPDDDNEKKYSIKFFDESSSFLFEIKSIKQTPVLLDKTNFYHAGWFKFELYADGVLIEKSKFKIVKDF